MTTMRNIEKRCWPPPVERSKPFRCAAITLTSLCAAMLLKLGFPRNIQEAFGERPFEMRLGLSVSQEGHSTTKLDMLKSPSSMHKQMEET